MLSLILAAGKGTRMKSNIPKVLHKVNGKAMLQKVIENTRDFGDVLLVLGHKKDEIIKEFSDYNYIYQKEQLGTGHAVIIAKDYIKKYSEVLITYGDGPLLTKSTLSKMYNEFLNTNLDSIMLTCLVDNPYGYGRIIKNNGYVDKIIEENEATPSQKLINEVNVGVYIFKTESLLKVLDKLDNKNKKNEYYLTDIIKIFSENNYTTKSILLDDKNEMIGVNSKKELAFAGQILRKRKLDNLMDNGVIIIDPNTTYIEDDVTIGMDTVIYPNTIIEGNTTIGENCTIYSSRIVASNISDNVLIDNSVIEYSNIGENVSIGPYAHLRKDSIIKNNVHIGNFVEIKNSTLNENVKTGHLTYIGDSIVGKNTNIGAGTITCNYDGRKKHKTIIGENAFIGSNSIFVAPVTVGDYVLTAAGSVITKNVEDGKLAIGRSKQVILNRKDI